MKDVQFDNLARGFAAGAKRRGILKALGAGLVANLVEMLVPEVAHADCDPSTEVCCADEGSAWTCKIGFVCNYSGQGERCRCPKPCQDLCCKPREECGSYRTRDGAIHYKCRERCGSVICRVNEKCCPGSNRSRDICRNITDECCGDKWYCNPGRECCNPTNFLKATRCCKEGEKCINFHSSNRQNICCPSERVCGDRCCPPGTECGGRRGCVKKNCGIEVCDPVGELCCTYPHVLSPYPRSICRPRNSLCAECYYRGVGYMPETVYAPPLGPGCPIHCKCWKPS
jgi:hypothetical protein